MVLRLHAGGHNIECETKNSARYKAGAGRRVGEMCEQLWAAMKVVDTAPVNHPN